MLLNALDFRTVEAALAAANDGDRVYIPSFTGDPSQQTWRPPDGASWRIAKSLEVFGDGPGLPGTPTGTTVGPSGTATPVFIIDGTDSPTALSIYIHDLKIAGAGAGGTASGIVTDVSEDGVITCVLTHRVVLVALPGDGIAIDATGGAIGYVGFTGSFTNDCHSGGVVIKGAEQTRLDFVGTGGEGGLHCESTCVAAYLAGGDNIDINKSDQGSLPAAILLDSCSIALLEEPRLEGFYDNIHCSPSKVTRKGCEFKDCAGAAAICGGAFIQPGDVHEPNNCCYNPDCIPPEILPNLEVPAIGITITLESESTAMGPVTILPCFFDRVQDGLGESGGLINVSGDAKSCVISPQLSQRENFANQHGDILLPSYAPPDGAAQVPNGGLSGSAFVRRFSNQAPLDDSRPGMFVPSGSADPSVSWIKDGMIFYNTISQRLRVRIDGAWKTVSTEIP